ncbi:hypothetical protein N9N77_00285 [Candidatus Pelagibacter sp.]|nr:hypothetical protein [Candidatus Pelagibacter sp.]
MDLNKKSVQRIVDYCSDHGLDFQSLPEIIDEPKVAPMVRGIGFEYVIKNYLNKILKNNKRFLVKKEIINSQLTVKGDDLQIYDKEYKKSYSLECKLAKNNSFSKGTKNRQYQHCSIKVMRSRTLGEEIILRLSKNGEATVEELQSHKDSYLYNHFDLVITNLRNAFYITNSEKKFIFKPNDEEWSFLENFFNVKSHDKIDDDLKNSHFYANSFDLAPISKNIECNRKKCPNPGTCKFIPNYPIFDFNKIGKVWKNLKNIEKDFFSK